MLVESAGGGQLDGSKQRGVLLGEPRQGRGPALHRLGDGALAGRRQVDRIPVRLQLPVGVDCREEIVVEEAVDGRVPVGLGLLTLGELPSIGVQQIMQGVDARGDLGGEAGIVQLDEMRLVSSRLRLAIEAAAASAVWGPGCSPSIRNIACPCAESVAYDRESTCRRSVARS